MTKIKQIRFDHCNGLEGIVESETGSPPQIIQDMVVELNYNGMEIYVKIKSLMTEGSEYLGEIMKIKTIETSNSDIAISDRVCFKKSNICSIVPSNSL